ncbi:MAG: BatA domain-containing protein, partial [Actinomycetota bacterium]
MTFVFAAPLALAALAILPVLWWLLKVTPPAPRLVRFPAIRLLFGLDTHEDSAARTPPWVLALRLALAAALILAAAHPLVDPARPVAGNGPLVVAIDDGWASARDWPERRAWLDGQLAAAERAGRTVVLLPTAPPADAGPVAASQPMAAADARAVVQALDPKPWPVDRVAAAEAVRKLPRDRVTAALWLSDGLDGPGSEALGRALQSLGGGLELVTGTSGRQLLPPSEESAGDHLAVTVRRAPADAPERVAVRALDGAGRVLGRDEATMAPGETAAKIDLRLPTQLRNRLVRLDIEGERSAAAVALLDERWRRRPVGLAEAAGEQAGAPLLDRLYYVERALAPFAELRKADLSELLAGEQAVIVLADVPAVLGSTADRLAAWVEGGGVLVRFAGPLLAHSAAEGGDPDRFLPVTLRGGGRSLGGAMSWTTPQDLAPFPDTGPFAGLTVPADVKVTAQVLAEPGMELAGRTWARLADGTPLVTAEHRGKGWVVLVHTTANTEWSSLALSGLFVDMLRRLVALAEGMPGKGGGPLPPAELLDGYGSLAAPAGAAAAITEGLDQARPGPRHPPGFYGEAGGRTAFNLSSRLAAPKPLSPPAGASVSRLAGHAHEHDLRPLLL